jgi:hypothetical protein
MAMMAVKHAATRNRLLVNISLPARRALGQRAALEPVPLFSSEI